METLSNEQNFRIHLLARAYLFRRGTYGREGYIGGHYVYSSLCSWFQIRQAHWNIDEAEQSTFNFFSRIWEAKPPAIFARLSPQDFTQTLKDVVALLLHVSYLNPAEQNLLAELIIKHGSDTL